jgi:hypothetical protein
MSTKSGRVASYLRARWRGPDAIERLTFLLGPGLFAVLVVGGFIAGVNEWHGMTFGDYLQGVAAGAGLLAVGHGIHRAERMRRSG